MKYFWIQHMVTGDVTIARYSAGVWYRIGQELAEIGLLEYNILKEIEHLAVEERPHHKHGHHKAVTGILTMTKTLQVGGTSTATIAYKDAEGVGVTLPAGNIPAWAVDQVALLDMVVAADGMSAALTAKGVGLATITVTAEGDPEPGVDTITVTGSVTIVDEASTGEITFS